MICKRNDNLVAAIVMESRDVQAEIVPSLATIVGDPRVPDITEGKAIVAHVYCHDTDHLREEWGPLRTFLAPHRNMC